MLDQSILVLFEMISVTRPLQKKGSGHSGTDQLKTFSLLLKTDNYCIYYDLLQISKLFEKRIIYADGYGKTNHRVELSCFAIIMRARTHFGVN